MVSYSHSQTPTGASAHQQTCSDTYKLLHTLTVHLHTLTKDSHRRWQSQSHTATWDQLKLLSNTYKHLTPSDLPTLLQTQTKSCRYLQTPTDTYRLLETPTNTSHSLHTSDAIHGLLQAAAYTYSHLQISIVTVHHLQSPMTTYLYLYSPRNNYRHL